MNLFLRVKKGKRKKEMNNSKSEEIQSKTLNAFFNTDEKTDVVTLPEIEEENKLLEEEPEEPEKEPADPEEELFEEKDVCIPGLGKINGPKTEKPKSQSIFDGGRAKYLLYGLMGVGLASQILK